MTNARNESPSNELHDALSSRDRERQEQIDAGATNVEVIIGSERVKLHHLAECVSQNISPDTRSRSERAKLLLGKRVRFYDPFRQCWDTGLVVAIHGGHIGGRRSSKGPFLSVQSDTQIHATRRDNKRVAMVNPQRAWWIDESGNPVDAADWVYLANTQTLTPDQDHQEGDATTSEAQL